MRGVICDLSFHIHARNRREQGAEAGSSPAAAFVVPLSAAPPPPYLVHPVADGREQRVPLGQQDGPAPVGGAQQVSEGEIHCWLLSFVRRGATAAIVSSSLRGVEEEQELEE